MSIQETPNKFLSEDFQHQTAQILGQHLGITFRFGGTMEIGNPPRKHRFDLVSDDSKCVGVCRKVNWTPSGYMPNAKTAALNEAVLYLSQLSQGTSRFIAIPRCISKQGYSLAEYYYQTSNHLLNGVIVFEIDLSNRVAKEVKSFERYATFHTIEEPPSRTTGEDADQEKHKDEVFLECYRILLGDNYMKMITKLYGLNPEKAIVMMKSDLEVVFGKRPKKTREEIKHELDDFFADIKRNETT